MFVVFILIGAIYSCSDKTKGETNSEESKEEAINIARKIFLTPDSIRTAEEKELFNQLEQAFYGGEFVILRNCYEIT